MFRAASRSATCKLSSSAGGKRVWLPETPSASWLLVADSVMNFLSSGWNMEGNSEKATKSNRAHLSAKLA
jgi:hypothetical protein